MTALIYKAALPTYTSLADLVANADENLVLNDAGTAYELEPGQGGASVRPTLYAQIDLLDGGNNLMNAEGVLFAPLEAELEGTDVGDPGFGYSSLSLHIGPRLVGAGAGVAAPQIAVPEGITVIRYLTFWVSNAACTQVKKWYSNDFDPLPVTPGPIRTLLPAEWTLAETVGADLTMGVDGNVSTTAGGIFFAGLVIELDPV